MSKEDDNDRGSLAKEAYQQNYQQFRSLNQIMWQIPVLAMTLTGGLWFGVSRISDNWLLVSVLLATAIFGNVVLSGVLYRFRHVMGCYLAWLKQADPAGFVDASQNIDSENRFERFCNRDKTVRTLFSLMLWWAALCSAIILCGYWIVQSGILPVKQRDTAIEYYDRYAIELANEYESVAFEQAYPFLVQEFEGLPKTVLDVGAGTGRDVSWIASKGHIVTAVEPSAAMRKIGTKLHPNTPIEWIDDRLPALDNTELKARNFEVVLLNAVWMHIPPNQREKSLQRIYDLVSPGGSAYVSLRLGPADKNRGMYEISSSKFVQLAKTVGFTVIAKGDFADLLGRPEVSWKMFQLQKI